MAKSVQDVEFYRDVKPILDRSCVACHTIKNDKPAGRLALDDYRPDSKSGFAAGHVTWSGFRQLRKGLPRTYARLAQYSPPFQSRRSPLIWKIYGRRLDGFRNEDIESPPLDYDNEQHIVNWGHHSHRNTDGRGLQGKRHAAAESGGRHLQGTGRQAHQGRNR